MSDTAPADAPNEPTDAATDDASEPDTGDQADDLTAELDKWKAQARKHEERAKANAKAAQELEEFRKQSMTETERAIEQARIEGRQQTLAEVGSKVAAAEVRAAATGRMSAEQIATLLDGLNLARFVGEDGEVDSAAVAQFVDGIAPPKDDTAPSPLDLGQGNRGTGAGPAKTDMDSLLRAAVTGRT